MSDEFHVPDEIPSKKLNPAEIAQELALHSSILWDFYSELKTRGFDDEQALRLVLNWHASMTSNP